MRFLTFAVVLTLLFLLPSCAPGRQRQAQPGAQERTTVQVQNQEFLDVTVYVLRSGQRIRLGLVPGVSTRTFPIPANLVFGATPLQFLADPVGSSQVARSFEITVQPGDQIQLIIPS